MKDVVGRGYLLDFYGALLTDRQRYCMKKHYESDLSLGEIADELKISRQAVYDNLQRANQSLDEYESKLHLVEQFQKRKVLLAKLRKTIEQEFGKSKDIEKLLNSL